METDFSPDDLKRSLSEFSRLVVKPAVRIIAKTLRRKARSLCKKNGDAPDNWMAYLPQAARALGLTDAS